MVLVPSPRPSWCMLASLSRPSVFYVYRLNHYLLQGLRNAVINIERVLKPQCSSNQTVTRHQSLIPLFH